MIIRTRRQNNYTTLPNATLQNSDLSWEARGLLGYLLSLPEGWEVRVTELSRRSPAGYAKNRRIISELERARHVIRSQQRQNNGQFSDWIFDVFDTPQPDCENPNPVIPEPVEPDSDGQKLEKKQAEKKHFKKDTTNGAHAVSSPGAARPEEEAADATKATEPASSADTLPNLPPAITEHLDAKTAQQVRRLLSQATSQQVDAFLLAAAKASPKSWPAWAVHMAKEAATGELSLPASEVEAKRSAGIEAQAEEFIRAAAAGCQIRVEGEPATVDRDGWVERSGRTESLRRLLALGARIEVVGSSLEAA